MTSMKVGTKDLMAVQFKRKSDKKSAAKTWQRHFLMKGAKNKDTKSAKRWRPIYSPVA